ncbi:hypothetical protein KQI86_05330 [Clostridium sp. MSJ-11]|uniref:Uncharacterized protein n=1 Tax=Clostridium mobile TaxID=2841512 RepID=A0ABS6EH65_9CLOT|nr:hypothetical protein [Clostridium mobile]MBU5483744.1 hypothetical protein [Clostridium mobile]
MASHFSSIGLNIIKKEDFSNYFNEAYENGEEISTELGTYIKWSIGNGVELWGQIDKNNRAIGMNPHFTGKSKMRVRITDKIKREDDTVLDGAFYCWADPQEGESQGAYPFVFDLPDMEIYREINTPQIVNAQITGFAHKISVYKDDEEFSNSQEKEFKLAPEAFIPVGLFNSTEKDRNSSQAMAMFTGHVVDRCKLRNFYTDIEFIWAKVSTLGGEFDIVVDPEILEGDICVNDVVEGTFWLSGRIIGEYNKKDKKRSLLNIFRKK